MSILKEKVLSFVKAKGPVLPIHINKEIGHDSFFSGAILSELVSNKAIKISYGKIGSSPVYYVVGQEPKLDMLYSNLPMREKEAYNLLKEKKIIRDSTANPGVRVALRMIKDFAIPLKLTVANKQELIWKWYLTSDQEIQTLAQSFAQSVQQQEIKVPEQKVVPQKPEVFKEEPVKPQTTKTPAPKVDFLQDIAQYVKTNNIRIIEDTMIRKNREFDLVVSIPSNIGNIEYLINAKNKKTLNEGDLSLAYQKGQSRKLPVILLINGELTKKARLYREKNLKGYVLVKKL